jgi:sugar O-acyltransferase (sialic acid O-acetyltransferase NeuD family)
MINDKKDRLLVIVGIGETSDIAYEYFTRDSPYLVVAFAASRKYIKTDSHMDLPLVPLEDLPSHYPPSSVEVYVAVSYTQLNRVRTSLFRQVKSLGYSCANYISSNAFVWHNVEMGENNFIFENNVLQHKVRLGSNIILWSGNHIGHQTVIEDNVYISSHCVISGYCRIGDSSFLGVNSTFNDKIIIAPDNIVGSGALVVRHTERGQLLIGSPAKPAVKSAYEAFGVTNHDV